MCPPPHPPYCAHLETDFKKCIVSSFTDLKNRDTYFRIGEVFSLQINMGSQMGLMVANCSLSGAAQNILSCDSEEKTKKMKFKTESIFTKAGFIESRYIRDTHKC